MIKVKDGNTIFFDVDDTLLMWGSRYKGNPSVTINFRDSIYNLYPNQRHIDDLILHKSKGDIVVVWSAGGADWAETATKALNLEAYVDVCLSKPNKWYDDLTANEILFKHDRRYRKFKPKQ